MTRKEHIEELNNMTKAELGMYIISNDLASEEEQKELSRLKKSEIIDFIIGATVEPYDDEVSTDEPEQEQESDPHVKKVWNINAMRPAIMYRGHSGQRTAINKTMCDDCEVDHSYLVQWVKDVDRLFAAACNYNKVCLNATSTEEEREEARNTILPLWKKVLEAAEPEKESRELMVVPLFDEGHISANALTILYDENAGILPHNESKTKFRSFIESWVYIRSEAVQLLEDSDRDALKQFKSAKTVLQNSQDILSELQTALDEASAKIDGLDMALSAVPEENTMFIDYLNGLKEQAIQEATVIKAEVTQAKADVKSAEDALEKARTAAAESYKKLGVEDFR